MFFRPDAEIDRAFWGDLAADCGAKLGKIHFYTDGTGPRTTIADVPPDRCDEILARIMAEEGVEQCTGSLSADALCQCGMATGVACDARGEMWVDYCDFQNASTAVAAGSWEGLFVRLRVSKACDEELRTIYDDEGDPTVYADAFAYADARYRP